MSLNTESLEQASSPRAPEMTVNTETTQMGEVIMAKLKRQSSLSPRSHKEELAKSSSARCLCSPTTHAGSFRCRHHRNHGVGRMLRGGSVGSNLSLLAAKSTPVDETKLNPTCSGSRLLD